MKQNIPHILLLEPYYGGSHRAFLTGLQKHLPFHFTLISLPARKWKMRMQLAAPWMADQTMKLMQQGIRFDSILCSTFIDVATLRALLAQNGVSVPVAIYFHENQFAYPNQIADISSFQFSALNFTSALAADAIAFNSKFNRDSFMAGVDDYLRKATDMDVRHKAEELRKKSVVLYPGIDFEGFGGQYTDQDNDVPVIVWNHRWEHDKDPQTFFETMISLSEDGLDFKLIILGQHFARCPDIFARAEKALDRHILHFGYASEKAEYIRLLGQGDIVVSTAIHEFFGMAVLEAVRCGCRPLVPGRLSYLELFPEKFRYDEGCFGKAMLSLLHAPVKLKKEESLNLTEHADWCNVAEKYEQWFVQLCSENGRIISAIS